MPYEDCNRCLRLVEGHLDQRMEGGKMKKRWVVFHGNTEEGIYQLKIYKKKDEKVTAEMQTISKSTFIGTEKGHVFSKKHGMNTMYWAVILKSATVIFHETTGKRQDDEEIVSIDDWHNALKSKFATESWPVNPLRGVGVLDGASTTLTMFLTKHLIGLATTTPPKCCKHWELSCIKDCRAFNNVLHLYLDTQSSEQFKALSYHEVQLRMSSFGDARRARDVIDRLRPKTEPISPSLEVPPPTTERYTPSPTSPRRLFNPMKFPPDNNLVEERGPPPLPPPRDEASMNSESSSHNNLGQSSPYYNTHAQDVEQRDSTAASSTS